MSGALRCFVCREPAKETDGPSWRVVLLPFEGSTFENRLAWSSRACHLGQGTGFGGKHVAVHDRCEALLEALCAELTMGMLS